MYIGLFKAIGIGGRVEKLAVTGNVAYADGTLFSVRGGGIAGINNGTVETCIALSGELSGTGGTVYPGRVVGLNTETLTNNYGNTAMVGSSWLDDASDLDGADCTPPLTDAWGQGASGLGWDWTDILTAPSGFGVPTLK